MRGCKLDPGNCGSSLDDRCLTDWTGWYKVRFTPSVTIESPTVVDDTADADLMALLEDVEEIVEAVMEPVGAPELTEEQSEHLVEEMRPVREEDAALREDA